MRETASGDTPPPQASAGRAQDATSRDRRADTGHARDDVRGSSRGADRAIDPESRNDHLTPRECAERWPLG